ncbi:unnamed protein product [Linum tenue]|uniref:Cytochrome P450 n=1 Tax=Linum tenue TaxID=586396 RepID=A0AAV0LHF7_9ROSI|nr:unnamed protein product [Linum tenue]
MKITHQHVKPFNFGMLLTITHQHVKPFNFDENYPPACKTIQLWYAPHNYPDYFSPLILIKED